jgi:ribonuclease P protein component
MLPKKNRITAPQDFTLTMRKGKRVHTPAVTIFIRKRDDDVTRYGFIVTKKTGNAVTRNKLKRQLREIAYAHSLTATTGADIIMKANLGTGETTWDELNTSILRKLSK